MKVYLKREPLNAGGYNRHGTYFGNHATWLLYRFDTEEGQYGFVRGADREAAKSAVREHIPSATFYR